MATSLEKVQELKQDLMGPPEAEADALELVLRTIVMTAGPMLEQMLPEDPGMLDDYLEWLAVKILRFRSDGAEPLKLMNGVPLELPPGE